jgi:hypothetical protein
MKTTHVIISISIGVSAAIGCSDGNSGGGGTVQFTASGEVLALGGYTFPPASDGDPAFVDGWEITFDELLVTLDDITLSENPDKSPTDQSQTDKAVAKLNGPWAVDLHKGGPLPGKGGGDEQAVAIATIDDQNLNGGAEFDASARYAFGFDIVAASDLAKQINFDPDAQTDYATMVTNGWSVLYAGTATWKGASCTTTDASYDFGSLPKTVKFQFGFKSPTTYVNCQNPDNDPAKPSGSEEHQRGIQIRANSATIAQATVHTDHPFWESFQHDTPAHFDQLAARAKQQPDGTWMVTLDETKALDFAAFEDAAGKTLPWRSCLDSYTPPDSATVMHFDSLGIPYDPNGDPSLVMRDYYDFMTYDQSTQGHLNSDGLCFIKRNYPSPD